VSGSYNGTLLEYAVWSFLLTSKRPNWSAPPVGNAWAVILFVFVAHQELSSVAPIPMIRLFTSAVPSILRTIVLEFLLSISILSPFFRPDLSISW